MPGSDIDVCVCVCGGGGGGGGVLTLKPLSVLYADKSELLLNDSQVPQRPRGWAAKGWAGG